MEINKILEIEKPEILHGLIERNFGIMTGKHHSDISTICRPDTLKTDAVEYFLKPEGAETFPQLVKRGEVVLKKTNRRHKKGNILLVTHGDIGKMIYASYYKLDWKRVLKMFHFGNSDMLLLSKNSPASVSHIFRTSQHNL